MSYVFIGILFLYLTAWVLKGGIRLLYWAFTPLYNWVEQTAYQERYPTPHPRGLKHFFTWPLSSTFWLYKWLDRHFRDLLGQYLVFATLLVLFLALGIESGNKDWFGLLILFLLTVALVPTLFLGLICEPFGLVRLSYRLAHLARFTYRRNFKAGPLFSAILAWKHVQNTEKAEAHRERLAGLLAQCSANEPAVRICRLLLAQEKREEEELIAQLQLLCFSDSFKTPRRITKHAGLWLVALESQRGNWQSVQKWSGLWLQKAPSTDLLFFYFVSRKMASGRVPGTDVTLFFAWLITFNYRYLPILKGAFQQNAAVMKRQLALLDTDSPDRLTGLQLLLRFAESPQCRENKELLHTLAHYFESILAAEEQEAAANTDKLQGLGQVEETLSLLLSSWNESAHNTSPSGDTSFLLHAMKDREETDLLEALDYHLQALQNRYTAGRFVTGEFEWQEWATIMTLYQPLALSDDTHYQAYQAVCSICWNWAAWLWNKQSEYEVSSGVLRWIRHEALAAGDYDTAESMDRNLRMT